MITEIEISIVKDALAYAQSIGAQKARATLSMSSEDLVATLNGEVDRVTHSADRSISFALFVDGKYGSFSTNKLDKASLENFLSKAVETARMVSEDPCRDLPAPERCCKEAVDGNELGLVDPFYSEMTPEIRTQVALSAAVYGSEKGEDWKIVAEEGEYSDSIYETVVMDTNGLFCRHAENSFDYGVELTIEDSEGEKYTGYHWDSSSRFAEIKVAECGLEALRKAVSQIGTEPAESGKYNMVVSREVASKFVSPVLRALNGFSIQQGNSFLKDSLGKKVFPDGMTVMDLPHIPGQTCSKFFDSEGVATKEGPIIEQGSVREYFVSTYMSNKMGMAPTIEDATRPKLMPWPKAGLGLDDILAMCGNGIYVTEFNGGNSNSATGDFSYGIEGFLFEDGKIVSPVSGMLVTGNFLRLWEGFVAAGDDARPCMSKLIPTLAFSNVDFSG